MYIYPSAASALGFPSVGEPPTLPPYQDPFPNIKSTCPQEWNRAMDAHLALQKFNWFEPYYKQLHEATHNSSLALGKGDELVLNPDVNILRNLVADEVGHHVAEKMASAIARWTFGPEVAKAFALLDIILKFQAAYQGIQNTKLVNEQRHSLRAEATQKKLWMFISIKARAITRKDPRKDEFKVRTWLYENYTEYDKRRKERLQYQNMNDSRCGKMRPQTTIRAR